MGGNMRAGTLALSLLVGVATFVMAQQSDAGNRFVTVPRDYGDTPAAAYAGLSAADCMSEVEHRGIALLRTEAVPGVDAPVRLAGPLHGVAFRQDNRSADEAINADGGIMDCRLALALDDFSEMMAARGVTEVEFISAYRRDTTGSIPAGQRHPSGLAIDIAAFHLKDGASWNVLRDFHGQVGARTCGRGAQSPAARNASSSALRRLVCDAGSARLFNLVLTPNYDRDHRNHVHFEVRRDIHWFLVQ